jgi:hypothetical protein
MELAIVHLRLFTKENDPANIPTETCGFSNQTDGQRPFLLY